jgi:hypothetical protein
MNHMMSKKNQMNHHSMIRHHNTKHHQQKEEVEENQEQILISFVSLFLYPVVIQCIPLIIFGSSCSHRSCCRRRCCRHDEHDDHSTIIPVDPTTLPSWHCHNQNRIHIFHSYD